MNSSHLEYFVCLFFFIYIYIYIYIFCMCVCDWETNRKYTSIYIKSVGYLPWRDCYHHLFQTVDECKKFDCLPLNRMLFICGNVAQLNFVNYKQMVEWGHTYNYKFWIYISVGVKQYKLRLAKLCEGRSKSSKPHPERKTIAEHFCYGNTLPLLKKKKQEKLIQISVLISVQLRLI